MPPYRQDVPFSFELVKTTFYQGRANPTKSLITSLCLDKENALGRIALVHQYVSYYVLAPGADPIKKIYSVNLCYAGSEHPDWLKIWSNQSECLKISQKFMLKIFIGLDPGKSTFKVIFSNRKSKRSPNLHIERLCKE